MLMASSSDNNTATRDLSVTTDRDTVTISCELSWPLTLGSQTRARLLQRKLKHRLRKWTPHDVIAYKQNVTARWQRSACERAMNAFADIEQLLDAFRQERLEPKVVEEILCITGHERRRWVKDGRLPKSGTGQFRKGRQVFQFYLHPAEEIAKIAKNPQIIAEWRKADREKTS
jgi:hypothetical protein